MAIFGCFKNFCLHLSHRGNDFIAKCVYAEQILTHTELTPNEYFVCSLQRKPFKFFLANSQTSLSFWPRPPSHSQLVASHLWASHLDAEIFKILISLQNQFFLKNLVLQALGTIRVWFLQKTYLTFVYLKPKFFYKSLNVRKKFKIFKLSQTMQNRFRKRTFSRNYIALSLTVLSENVDIYLYSMCYCIL